MDERTYLEDVMGRSLTGAGGADLGRVTQVYRDNDTQRPEWAVVETTHGRRFVPLREVTGQGETPQVPYAADQVAAAPEVDADAGHLSRAQEAELYQHYGLDYDVSTLLHDRTGLPVGLEGPGPDRNAADRSAEGEHLGRHRAPDGDLDVGRGVLDAGVAPRDQAATSSRESEVSFGTGIGGSLMGNASTRSSAGTNANTDLSARDDLDLTTGTERSSREGMPGDEVRGDAMTDIAEDRH